jgi:predicted O-linked N-acetylglucosamine transferase (SPINDLY family)
MSINKKLLLKWTSNDDAALAAQKQISALQEGGYKISNFEPPALISFGTISTLSQKAQMFQDCLDIHPSQITDVSQAVLGHHSADESEEEAEEKKTEKQVVAANLEIDQLSHSVATLNDESVKELALADFESESIAERTKEYERFRDENERGTLMARNKHVQPLGPSAPGMIAVMLLNPYKNMDVSSSCF